MKKRFPHIFLTLSLSSLIFTCSLGTGLLMSGTGCFGPSSDRNALTVVQMQRSAVENALIGWNSWLGSQQRIVAVMVEPQKAARIAEIQKIERKIESALVEYNKAQETAKVAFTEYTEQKAIDATKANFSLVQVRIDQFKSASLAVIEIIAVWVPQVKGK